MRRRDCSRSLGLGALAAWSFDSFLGDTSFCSAPAAAGALASAAAFFAASLTLSDIADAERAVVGTGGRGRMAGGEAAAAGVPVRDCVNTHYHLKSMNSHLPVGAEEAEIGAPVELLAGRAAACCTAATAGIGAGTASCDSRVVRTWKQSKGMTSMNHSTEDDRNADLIYADVESTITRFLRRALGGGLGRANLGLLQALRSWPRLAHPVRLALRVVATKRGSLGTSSRRAHRRSSRRELRRGCR